MVNELLNKITNNNIYFKPDKKYIVERTIYDKKTELQLL